MSYNPFFFADARADDLVLFAEVPEDRLEGAPTRMQGVDLSADRWFHDLADRSILLLWRTVPIFYMTSS